MNNVGRLGTVGMVVGLAAVMPGPLLATPVDEETMDKVEPPAMDADENQRKLIEMGRDLFLNETFDGNGRTCGTCHPATNNFTIDKEFIAGLPDDDPLFVAETNPDLAELEDMDLLRNHALILENLDGFNRPPVFRSVPHTLALPTSIEPDPENLLAGPDGPLVHALGWSGDGSPDDGSLRMFTVGAIIQHMPKTLGREEGVDFRLPTAEELDAIEAFMMSLGRQEDIDLAALNFSDETVARGKLLFNDEDELADRSCSGCHANAGANNSRGNRNRATGVALLSDLPAPGDGGFGFEPRTDHGGILFSGDGGMNTPPLIEAADTPPFFHNNSAPTIEAAVEFYTSEEFANSTAGDGRPFDFSTDDINAVGALLRALNAMENIRNGGEISLAAQRSAPKTADERIGEVVAETEDAVQVLTGGPVEIYLDEVDLLEQALELERGALATDERTKRNRLLQEADALKQEARTMILVE